MELKNTFDVAADPDTVFDFLVDAPQVAQCIPGVAITEIVDDSTFRGNLKVKVGPVTVRYGGVGRILSIDRSSRTATIDAEGEEQGASGSVKATMVMSVTAAGSASRVQIATDLAIAGRVATMGKGVIEQVGNGLVAQTSKRIEQAIMSPSVPTAAGEPTQQPVAALADGSEQESMKLLPIVRGIMLAQIRSLLLKFFGGLESASAKARRALES